MEQHPALINYLARYAEAEAGYIARCQWPHNFNHVLVIPTYDEPWQQIQHFLPLCDKNRALLILVINQPKDIAINHTNQILWKQLHDDFSTLCARHNLTILRHCNTCILAIDRFQSDEATQTDNAIEPKQGVGLARKIGCDIATSLINEGLVDSTWIHCSDADALLPPDYFQQTANLKNDTNNNDTTSAVVYPFQHSGDPSPITTATKIYEQSLCYYVDGLRWAHSPYAFHTIGSCLAINATDYCRVRGFPKRAGGEDFYLLNKLAKLNGIKTLSGNAITLQARRSQRTPFGTGPAVEKILTLDHPWDYPSYNPKVFLELKKFLKLLSQWWDFKDTSTWLQQLSPISEAAAQALNFDHLFTHLRKQARDPKSTLRHSHIWFDGFRTLKYIHWLQNHSYPPVPLRVALEQTKAMFTEEV